MHNRRSAADGEEIGVISERDYSELVNKTENEVSDVWVESSCLITADCVWVCMLEFNTLV